MTIPREVPPPEGPPGHKGSTEGSKKITVKDRVPPEEVSSGPPPPFFKILFYLFHTRGDVPLSDWIGPGEGRCKAVSFLRAPAALACSREPTTLVVQADLTTGHVPSGGVPWVRVTALPSPHLQEPLPEPPLGSAGDKAPILVSPWELLRECDVQLFTRVNFRRIM